VKKKDAAEEVQRLAEQIARLSTELLMNGENPCEVLLWASRRAKLPPGRPSSAEHLKRAFNSEVLVLKNRNENGDKRAWLSLCELERVAMEIPDAIFSPTVQEAVWNIKNAVFTEADTLPPLGTIREKHRHAKDAGKKQRAALKRCSQALLAPAALADHVARSKAFAVELDTRVKAARDSAPRGKGQKDAAAAKVLEEARKKTERASADALAQALKRRRPKNQGTKKARKMSIEGPGVRGASSPQEEITSEQPTNPPRSRRKAPRHDRHAQDVAVERNGTEIHSPGHEPEGARPLPRGGHQLARGSASVRKHVRGNHRPTAGRVKEPPP
jgi:hypothetical protein